ncbi:HAD-IA family hydrolase [Eubacterium callanderi]|uniref:HAD family phosphatase n=1 Tax=Eubacterium callanderi TaxID=53442 RepID=A0A853JIN7_9FIRM|nr:HAD family phosphatase [Eubacterium callanderi]
MGFQAVIFDMDGVLIDSEPFYLKERYKFIKNKNPSISIEKLFPVVGLSTEDAWKYIASIVHNGQSWEELLKEYTPIAETAYLKADYKKLLRGDVLETLQNLSEQGYRLGVASANSQILIRRILKQTDAFSFLDVIISGEECRENKPAPDIYLKAAEELGICRSKCFVVEDSFCGIMAAKRANMTVAALSDKRFSFQQERADYQINTIYEIIKILRKVDENENSYFEQ